MELIKNWLNKAADFALANVLPAVVILAIGIIIISVVNKLVKRLLKNSKMEKAAHSLIISVVRIALYLLLGLTVASSLGINVTGVVALVSVLTLAISLSVQNLLTNLLGGFTLMSTKPFISGDYVEIAGQSGTVLEIGLPYTKLRTPDNKEVSIPNSAVVSAQIINYTVTGTRRVEVYVSASYDAPIPKVLEALREAAKVPTVLPEQEVTVAVNDYGESTISYLLFVWCKTEDYWKTTFAIRQRVKEIFDEKQVEMSYPHINVHLDK